jgi:nucleoside-diphosphate-sugar epimerase
MAGKRYLVTGGLGFIGSALVCRLVKADERVRVLDNQSRGSLSRLAGLRKRIEFIDADVCDARAVRQALKGIDCVWHLASVNGTELFYKQPELVLEVGVKGILNVLAACIKENVGELILASSSEVYQAAEVVPTDETAALSIPDPLNPRYSYAAAKIISEIMAVNYGRKQFKRVVIFRPHNVYGPDMGSEHVVPQFVLRMHRLCQASTAAIIDFPIQGSGKETRSFVFIEDCIDGLMLLGEKGAHLGIYHIGTAEELTVEQVAREVGRYFKREIKIVPQELSRGSPLRRCPDISKIAALGYKPKYKFCHGLPIAARWYVENERDIIRNK